MRTMTLKDVSEELRGHIQRKELFPIIGSGFTRGCKAKGGEGKTVPSGDDMREDMIQYLKDHNYDVDDSLPFSKVALYYDKIVSDEDYWHYFDDRFTDIELPENKREFLGIDWKLIYTLNLDDAIEKNSRYTRIIRPCQDIRLDALEGKSCLFKLHGDAEELVTYREKQHVVLSIVDYIDSFKTSRSMLQKLEMDLDYSNTLFVGCSLSDELDLLSVAQSLKGKSTTHRNRYIVLDKKPDKLQEIDLENYGIDTVIIVDDFNTFYDDFNRLAREIPLVSQQELENYHNLLTGDAPDSKAIDYLVCGKYLLDRDDHRIKYPSFFVERDIEKKILNGMQTKWLQIVHGARVSGKSYLLAGLLKRIRNRDVYYFDSRSQIDETLILTLLELKNCVILIDTNVLCKKAQETLLRCDISLLKKNSINVVLCINNSDRDALLLVRDLDSNMKTRDRGIEIFELKKSFSDKAEKEKTNSEIEVFNEKLKALKIVPFDRSQTILDNLLMLQKDMRLSKPTKFDSPLKISEKDSSKMALLILLAQNEKVTANELVRCGLIQKNAELLQELKVTVEEDHCHLLAYRTLDQVSYQVVCNAKVWILGQIRAYGSNSRMTNMISEAFKLIVDSFLHDGQNYKLVEQYVKFDKLNELFPNGKNLIIRIYNGLQSSLSKSYQYYHQCAKCHSWGMSDKSYDTDELEEARLMAITAYKMVQEFDISGTLSHRMAYAHILNTLTIIYAKLCFLEEFSNHDTISQTIDYFDMAIRCQDNYEAMQLSKTKGAYSREEEGGAISKWVTHMVPQSGNLLSKDRKKLEQALKIWFDIPTLH